MSGEVFACLDLGSSKLAAAVVQRAPDGRLWVKGVRVEQSSGIRKGTIRDLSVTTREVDAALSGAAYAAGLSPRQVWVVLNCPHILSLARRASLSLENGGEVSEEHLSALRERARPAEIPAGYGVIDQLARSYTIDDEEITGSPVGMYGRRLAGEFLFLLGPEAQIHNLEKVLSQLDLELAGLIYAPLADAIALTTREQREAGVLVIDLGAGVTSFALYLDGSLLSCGAVPVGSRNYDLDIKHGLGVSLEEATRIKQTYARAYFPEGSPELEENIEVRHYGKRHFERVRKAELAQIINPRTEEHIELLAEKLSDQPLEEVRAGAVLCGGGAKLRGIDQRIAGRLGIPVEVGRIGSFAHLSEEYRGPEMASLIGSVLMLQDHPERTAEADGGDGGGLIALLERLNEVGLSLWEWFSRTVLGARREP